MSADTTLPGAPFFSYNGTKLLVEDCTLHDLAQEFGTPLFVYSQAALADALDHYKKSLSGRDSLICYAVKANSNLSILRWLVKQDCGFDTVSGGELARVIAAGASPDKIIFSGVGKSKEEMTYALACGIGCFNVESEAELVVLNEVALRLGKKAPISIRVNPDVDAKTHPYISTGLKNNKFGIDHEHVVASYIKAATMPGIEIRGIDCHIGSQITEEAPYLDALDKLIEMMDGVERAGIHLAHIDFGGGLGIRYNDEVPLQPEHLWFKLLAKLDAHGYGQRKILIEPGRSLIGNAGVCLSTVLYLKHGEYKNFCIVDTAMTEMPRPALYGSFHGIFPVTINEAFPSVSYDVVGPVCESGDWLGRDRLLSVVQDDVVAIFSAGAYCMSMSSNYNSRPRAAEVLIEGSQKTVIRKRETIENLWLGE
jgi:diaminopimelate decarboxylase